MTYQAKSGYWLDQAVAEIVTAFPEGPIVLSSGISPSASYHIGHFREILTADALTWGLKHAGREAIHKHVVDNFDPLRRRYDFLPEEYEQYVGWPICLVPDPYDKCRYEHKTYAEHFYQEFEGYARQMGVVPEEVIRSYEQLYAAGKMAGSIEKALACAPIIKQIFKEVSKRELPEDWLPLQMLGPNNSFTELKFVSIDKGSRHIKAMDEAGKVHEIDYTAGQAKLNWRLDWPARWQVLGVQVEPFGAQEHGAAGGSYDTGARFSREVFGYEPPLPGVRYANIHMLGDTKKMSSSKGNLVTPPQALDIMPPEILRYFVVRSKPDRTLYFDSEVGLYNLLDEYSQIEAAVQAGEDHEFAEAYQFASSIGSGRVISGVSFNHLVSVYQAALGKFDQILEILARTGYESVVEKQPEVLAREIPYVENWLAKYAPDNVKFEVQKELPGVKDLNISVSDSTGVSDRIYVELSDEQKKFLTALSERLTGERDLSGQGMHDLVYATAQLAGIKPGQAFQALYRVILGKDSGPKAGWFLVSLDHDWLVERLALRH